MAQVVEAKVPFTLENVRRCLCPGCPVQGKSECVDEKRGSLQAALSHNPLKPEEVPGQYCSAGPATCEGLDATQQCSCFDCQVYADYKLSEAMPTCYYCLNGKAA